MRWCRAGWMALCASGTWKVRDSCIPPVLVCRVLCCWREVQNVGVCTRDVGACCVADARGTCLPPALPPALSPPPAAS
eukprot:3376991-Rhodomonas_salina.1